jgi:hypothetical protein
MRPLCLARLLGSLPGTRRHKLSVLPWQYARAIPRATQVRQPIDIRDLAWIAHVVSPRALRELVAEIGKRHIGPEPLDQTVYAVPTGAAAF